MNHSGGFCGGRADKRAASLPGAQADPERTPQLRNPLGDCTDVRAHLSRDIADRPKAGASTRKLSACWKVSRPVRAFPSALFDGRKKSGEGVLSAFVIVSLARTLEVTRARPACSRLVGGCSLAR